MAAVVVWVTDVSGELDGGSRAARAGAGERANGLAGERLGGEAHSADRPASGA
jgi:hypothetical protein